MNNKERTDIRAIAEHVTILNEEVGKLQVDVKWLKKLLGYMAIIVTGVFVSVVGAVIKYMFIG